VITYSVWNYGTRSYDYYTAPGAPATHAGRPPVRGGSSLGAAPEQAAWPLPAGARKVGSGPLPKGRIASTSGGISLGGLGAVDLSDPVTVGAVIVLSYVAWKNRRHLL